MSAFSWTHQILTRLRALSHDGLPSAEIAAVLNAEFNTPITRNAVIGKCRREGIPLGRDRSKAAPVLDSKPRKPKAIKPKPERRPMMKPEPVKAEPSLVRTMLLPEPETVDPMDAAALHALFPMPERSSAGLTLFDLGPHSCRWVLPERSENDEALFCGEAAGLGKSYCKCHSEIVWQKPARPGDLFATKKENVPA